MLKLKVALKNNCLGQGACTYLLQGILKVALILYWKCWFIDMTQCILISIEKKSYLVHNLIYYAKENAANNKEFPQKK